MRFLLDTNVISELRIALRTAALQVPDPRPTSDTLIAATALAHDMTLATRNIRDVEATGMRLLNPWNGTHS